MALALVAFLAVFLAVVAGAHLVSGWLNPDAARARKRMAEEFSPDRGPSAVSPLYKNLDLMELPPDPSLGSDGGASRPAPQPRGIGAELAVLLEQANLPWTPKQLFWAAAGLSLALGLPATYFGGMLVGSAAVAAGAAAPFIYVNVMRKARREKYLKQLPNAFDLMARVIRAGQSVPQALQAVADAFEDPLAGEFANCLKQQNLGLRPEVTFQGMAERSCILEVRIFAMAMLIQRQTGGNLSEVLDRLAGLVRARLKLKQQVRTLTAEGRLQGWTLVVLPFLVFGVMMVINRPYIEVLFQHVSLLVATVTSMGLGILWIRKIVDIDG